MPNGWKIFCDYVEQSLLLKLHSGTCRNTSLYTFFSVRHLTKLNTKTARSSPPLSGSLTST